MLSQALTLLSSSSSQVQLENLSNRSSFPHVSALHSEQRNKKIPKTQVARKVCICVEVCVLSQKATCTSPPKTDLQQH